MRVLAILLVLPLLLLGGCGGNDDDDTPPASGEAPTSPTARPSVATTLNVSVYFAKAAEGGTTVVPVRRSIEAGQDLGVAAMAAMIKGPTAEEVSQGLSTALPTTAKLLGLTTAEGVATANFASGSLPAAGTEGIATARRQIERTLRQFPGVRQVVIQLEGQPLP